jgi:uncharacterized protein
MSAELRWPIFGVLVAIAITSTMDATGLAALSALPLAPLLGAFWYLQRLSRKQVGFSIGRGRRYFLAVLYPLGVMAALALAAAGFRAIDLSHTDWRKVGLNFVLVSVSNALVAIVTEEGFFRGWLWASLERAGLTAPRILLWTSVAFALWHWSAAILASGFRPPPSQVPTFLLNVAAIGAVFGMLRWRSGSVIVSSVSHGVWNGIAYVFFGVGEKVGALGIQKTGIFGPEVGMLALALNLLVLAFCFLRARKEDVPSPVPRLNGRP